MSDWRKNAANQEWFAIDLDDLSNEEKTELIAILKQKVPMRTRGDGLETFDEPYLLDESDSVVVEAKVLLQVLLRERKRNPRSMADLFRPAMELAIDTICQELGIRRYEGLLNTYLLQHSDGNYVQFCTTFGHALLDKMTHGDFAEFVRGKEVSYTDNAMMWVLRCPWRRVITLAEHWRRGAFEPNSSLDHAMAIVDAELRLRTTLRVLGYEFENGESSVSVLLDPWFITNLVYSIGQRYDALLKKPVEKIAISKLEEVKRNRESGRRANHSFKAEERRRVLSRLAVADGGFAYLSDKEAIRMAKSLARKHIAAYPDEKLFVIEGRLLSDRWFTDWWQEFRLKQRNVIKYNKLTSE